jgi:hypothetical protein
MVDPLELFLVPHNPLQTVLVSSTGIVRYSVQTDSVRDIGYASREVTAINRVASTESVLVARIAWKMPVSPLGSLRGTSSTVYGDDLLVEGMRDGVLVKDFLYKLGPFSK